MGVGGHGHPMDKTCTCGHKRSAHSKHGCTDGEYRNGQWKDCPCKRKYMEI